MNEMPWFIKNIVFGNRESIPKDELADRLFNSMDENKDGQLAESELAEPLIKLVKAGDSNGDGLLSRDELISGIGSSKF